MNATVLVPANAIRNPNTGEPVTAAQAFAAWLEVHEPALFQALAEKAAAAGARTSGLADWSSILSSIESGVTSVASDIGSGISDAASGVGNFLTSSGGLQSLSTLANTYLQSQQQQTVLQTQLARANQGLPPAPISYTTNAAGQVIPVYTGSTLPMGIQQAVGAGQSQFLQLPNGTSGYTLNNASLASLGGGGGIGGFLQKYGLELAIAGGGLVVLALLIKRTH